MTAPIPEPTSEELGAIVLEGGRATRMAGRRKAFLEVAGRPIAHRLLDALSELVVDVVVATSRPEAWEQARGAWPRLRVRTVEDPITGAGPLAGVAAGLSCLEQRWAFVVAADMPCVQPDLVRLLLARARDEPGRAVVPVAAGRPQVLHAIVPTAFASHATEALAAGTRRVADALASAGTTWLDEAELAAVEHAGRSFLNVNRPEDLDALEDALAD